MANGEVEILESASRIDPALWRGAFSGEGLDGRYYELLEASQGEQFEFRYAVLNEAVQPFFLVNLDIASGLPRRVRLALSHTVPGWTRLTRFCVLVAGCAAGEGHLATKDRAELAALEEALTRYARGEGARLVVFKDLPASCREPMAALRGYRRIASMPSTRLDLNFATFEEYLQTRLSGNIRGNLRRKIRDTARANLTLEVTADASAVLSELHALYLQTYWRSPYRFECLTSRYFSGLGERFPGSARFFLWRREGRLLAFAAGLIHGKDFRYLNIGMAYPEALELHLYFWAWRGLVSWALEQGLESIEAGQLNYEPKFRLGLRLVPLDLYVKPLSPRLRAGLALVWPLLSPVRYDPALRKFANFGDL